MNITTKLERLLDHMRTMGEIDLGDLQLAEAALFHIATDAVERALESVRDRSPVPYTPTNEIFTDELKTRLEADDADEEAPRASMN